MAPDMNREGRTRVKELLQAQCKAVHGKENYALRFILTEQIATESPEFCLFETYIGKEATDLHLAQPHFKQLMSTLQDEKLLTKAPSVWKTKSVAGFDLDRKCMSAL
ncbi:hypothetical protein K4K49_003322 [Colletotrichum sp. SAR 10_70]|nr:hypothetical protein K4K50_011130 [Colletotrichum sp. SAR 10_71]KAI8172833.1 hypothetical protein K4K49_003322 [Colletotrichum sp. SAR 10_70]KAJ5005823.1 hypothetical protein K4K48_005907 [Colletotrichum sp. SAR 10_66]